ncbi:hypothetical protein ACFSC4_10515 [Deinococcus malanensis]
MSVNPNVLLALLKAVGTPGRFIGCEHLNYKDAPASPKCCDASPIPN